MSPSTDLLIQMARLGLDGQTVLITGGSGGIGAALADLFYRSGCKVIITGTSQAKLDKVLPEAVGGKVLRYECDIRDNGAVEGVVKRIAEDGHTVDVLINNAGYALNATCPLWEQDVQDLDAVLDVDLKGLIYMTPQGGKLTIGAVLKHHMIPRKPHSRGTILNVSSITGHQAPLRDFFEVSYHTSKAGVEGFSNVLRHELVNTNIRVLVHRPGTVLTEFHSRRLGYDQAKTDAMFDGIAALQAQDIAVGILWQCLQPERVSVVMMETLPSSQRSLYAMDRGWEERNGRVGYGEWE